MVLISVAYPDQNKEQRGEGFELRTDEWGAIAANKGLYLTSQTEPKAQGKQLDMQGAITQLENALSIAKALQNAATSSEAHSADTDSQEQLKATLTQLAQSGIIAYAQEGIALTSPENIQLSTSNSVSMTSENQTDINALKNITVSSGESIGLFAHKSGMKVFANQGDVNVQAQNANLNMAAKQDIKIDSVNGKLTVTASKELTLMCGGSYIKLSSAGIELGTADNVYIKSNALQKMGPKAKNISEIILPNIFNIISIGQYSMKFLLTDNNGQFIADMPYKIWHGESIYAMGTTDSDGYTSTVYSETEIPLHVEIDIDRLGENNAKKSDGLGYIGQYSMKFLLTDNNGQFIADMPYKIWHGESIYAMGTTDSDGYTSTVYSETEIPLHVEIDIDRLGENNARTSK